MPPASQVNKVLVSGASGFIAAWVVRTLLERGHHVRGTVRSPAKGDYLKRLFKEHGGKFEYVIVEDIAKERAFDDAVKGMDAVIHTASPFHLKADDPQELIVPAVKGTTTILESVLKHAPAVKRVVITSSTASVSEIPPVYDPPKSTIFTEKDWNLEAIRLVEERGGGAPQVQKYRASKVLAERSAWEFVERHKAEIGWDLVTLEPPFVFGPVIHDVPSPKSLNQSASNFLELLKNDPPKSTEALAAPAGNFVDVRDVAWAHAEALINDEVAGKSKDAAFNEGNGRVILSAGPYTWQDVVDVITASSSTIPKTTPKGNPGAGKKTVPPVVTDSTRAREVLGLKFRTSQETFVDTLEDYRQKGWVE